MITIDRHEFVGIELSIAKFDIASFSHDPAIADMVKAWVEVIAILPFVRRKVCCLELVREALSIMPVKSKKLSLTLMRVAVARQLLCCADEEKSSPPRSAKS